MKNIIFSLVVFLLASCSPSEAQMAAALAQTLTARATDTPTNTPTPEPTPDLRIIAGKPTDYLLSHKDMPNKYWNPGGSGWDSPTTNAEILGIWGVEEGSKYIDQTGRIEGHMRCFQRSTNNISIPEEICLQIIFYETFEGASLTLSPDWEPLGWSEETPIDIIETFGDECVYSYYEEHIGGGAYDVRYEIEFRVRNVVGVVSIWGRRDYIELQYAIDIARMLEENLLNAPLINP